LIGAVSTEPVVRSLWRLYEPLHAVTYFAPQARAAFESAGLRGFWRRYALVERSWLAQDGRRHPPALRHTAPWKTLPTGWPYSRGLPWAPLTRLG